MCVQSATAAYSACGVACVYTKSAHILHKYIYIYIHIVIYIYIYIYMCVFIYSFM